MKRYTIRMRSLSFGSSLPHADNVSLTGNALFCPILFGFLLGFSTMARAEFDYIAPDLLARAPVMTIAGEGLTTGLRKIVPEGFTVTLDPAVSRTAKIQWDAKKDWQSALRDALKPLNLRYDRQGTTVRISPAPPKKPPVPNWQVKSGQRLSGVLEDWGKKAKVRIRFLTDRDWSIEADYRFTGSFEKATRALLEALSTSDPAPIAELRNNRTLLLVLHRPGSAGDIRSAEGISNTPDSKPSNPNKEDFP